MQNSKIVERGSTLEIFTEAMNPYTKELLKAIV